MTKINVVLDERIRLFTAVLAASDWPEEEQTQLTHAVHPHAKRTRHFVRPFRDHAAVQGVNDALLNGVSLNQLMSVLLCCRWPDFAVQEPLPNLLQINSWVKSLPDFAENSGLLDSFWPDNNAPWETAVHDLTTIFADTPLPNLMAQLAGRPLKRPVNLMPTVVYPMLTPLLAESTQALLLLLPPPKAVGESPPWPYAEDPVWVVAQTAESLLLHTLAPVLAQLDDQPRETLIHAAIAVCLTQTFDAFEGQAYIIRRKKEHALPDLPQVAERLTGWLDQAETTDITAVLQK